MPWLVETFVLLCILSSIHIAAMASAAHIAGITVRKVSFGAGPTLWESGKFRLGWIPLSGYVRMKDSRTDLLSETELDGAFDHAPAWKQIAVPLAGLGALMLLSMLTLGHEGIEALVRAFRQLILGAIGPFSDAQAYLQAGKNFAGSHSPLAYAGLLGAKLVAMNLLPFNGTNGLQILVTLVRGKRPAKWEDYLPRLTIVPALLLFGGWLVAIASNILRS